MSNEMFPNALMGFAWDCKKKPVFNNITHSPPTGRDVRIALYSQPMYEFDLVNNWLSKADKDTLMGFFLARSGTLDSFLYQDEDSMIAKQLFATGDGTTTVFQLRKKTALANEIANNIAPNPVIYNGTVQLSVGANYTLDATGLVTFTNPPATGSLLSWSGAAYYRCIFLEDSLEYNQFADRLYDCGEIKFKGSLANKL